MPDNIELSQLVYNMIHIAVTLVVTFLLLRLSKAMMNRQEKKNGPRIHIKFLSYVFRLFVILLAMASIGSRFDGFKSTLNTILASSGILALGISLAAQASLTNIIDGLFISMFRPFNIGDRVTLPEKNNLTGIVQEINLRHTIIRTYSNTSYIIPNSVMSTSIIDNSNFQTHQYAYPIDVTVSYDADLDKALELVYQAVTTHPDFFDPRTPEQKAANEPMVTPLVRCFGSSGIELRCMMITENVGKSFKACSEVRIAIKRLFDANDIGIPYTTIHLDNYPAYHEHLK